MNARKRTVAGVVVGLLALLTLLGVWAPRTALAETQAVVCANLDALPLGQQYGNGASFTSNGLTFTVSGAGFVQVENTGKANGSGREIEVNNVLVSVNFAANPGLAPVDAAAFRYGDYGGFVKLLVNADLQQRDDFSQLDGDVVGGAAVSVVAAGANPELGTLTAVGAISGFGFFGQELWVDDICLRKGAVDPPEPNANPDLGDAPDSSNHVGINNTAYPATPGRFPTVWDATPVGAGTGPKHLNPTAQLWLGNLITAERDADPPFADSDGVNNILNGGADNADNDRYDDGWRNRLVPMPNCVPTTLIIRIRRAPAATEPVMYLNVWNDGNSDGDWQDSGPCTVGGQVVAGAATEWIVRNRAIAAGLVPAGGFIDLPIGTMPVLNTANARPSWVRFMLSERPVPPGPGGALPDGRGPDFPNAWKYGETEDYLRRFQEPGQPGPLQVRKTQQGTSSGSVQAGANFTYTVHLRIDGGSGFAGVRMTDTLPAGVVPIGPVKVTVESPTAGPLLATLAGNQVSWNGFMTANALVRFDIPVRARGCIGQPLQITNTAVGVRDGAAPVSASVQTTIVCAQGSPPVVVKRILEPRNGTLVEVVESDIVPGTSAIYRLKLNNPSGQTVIVRLRDPLPTGLVAGTPTLPLAVIERTVTLAPGASTQIDVPVRLVRRTAGEQQLVNIAYYVSCIAGPAAPLCSLLPTGSPLVQATNPVTLTVKGRDLGDAPDSTNHFGAGMTAYPAVAATYPTVYQAGAPPFGPVHTQPQLLHLGNLVSREANADIGLDADIVNNLRPPANVADRDRFDDGVNPVAIPFADCRKVQFKVRITVTPAAIPLLQNGIGYLNAWVDGTRDGDWADTRPCPLEPGAPAPFPALEHFLIDYPVNIAALGPGVHDILVTANQRVLWPAATAGAPAWLRLMLSERPSEKPLLAPGVPYGDGRGPQLPYRLGETEDYFYRLPQVGAGADIAVRIAGRIVPRPAANGAEAASPLSLNFTKIVFMEYRNVGSETYLTIELENTMISSYQLGSVEIDAEPPLSYTVDLANNRIRFTGGALEPGASGRILIRGAVTPEMLQQSQVSRVEAIVPNDADPSNNVAEVDPKLLLPAPVILAPRSGDTSSAQQSIGGAGTPGTQVDLYVDGAKTQSGPVDAGGAWQINATLAAGEHLIHAVTVLGAATSDPSSPITLNVDPTLPFDPISLRVVDSNGRTWWPRGVAGSMQAEGWTLLLPYLEAQPADLEATSAFTLVVKVREQTTSVALMEEEGISYFCGAGTPDANGIIAILIGLLCAPENGSRPAALQVQGADGVQLFKGSIARAAVHTVIDARTGQPLAGATVRVVAGNKIGVDPAAADAASQVIEQVVTDAQGHFSLGASNPSIIAILIGLQGYQPVRLPPDFLSGDTGRVIPLMPTAAAGGANILALSEDGFDPPLRRVLGDRPVQILNIDIWEHAVALDLGDPSGDIAAAGAQPSLTTLLGPGESLIVPAGVSFTARDLENPDASAALYSSALAGPPVLLPIVVK